MSIRRRLGELERRIGGPGEKPSAVLLCTGFRPGPPGERPIPVGPFEHAGTGETFETLEAAGERFGTVLLMPRKDTTATRQLARLGAVRAAPTNGGPKPAA